MAASATARGACIKRVRNRSKALAISFFECGWLKNASNSVKAAVSVVAVSGVVGPIGGGWSIWVTWAAADAEVDEAGEPADAGVGFEVDGLDARCSEVFHQASPTIPSTRRPSQTTRYRPGMPRSGGRGWLDADEEAPADDGDLMADMGVGPRATRLLKLSIKDVFGPVVNRAAKYKLGSNFAA